jgi:hypothetical protein
MSAQQETNSAIEIPVPPAAGDTAAAPVSTDAPTDANASANDRDDKGRFRNPVQPRIDELTRKTREAEREAAYWKGRAETRENAEAEAAKAKAAEKPTPEQFDDYNAYVEALADWKADEKIKANNEAQKQESAKERTSREKAERWTERSNAARTAHSDYDQVLEAAAGVKLADFVCDALDESEQSAELLYRIAQDPSIADRLNAMSPRGAALELGRMEAKLPAVSADPDPEEVPDVKAPAAAPAAPVRKTTSAPPPVKPIAKGGSTAVDLSKLRGDDYVKARAAQGAKWARR